MDRPDPSSIPNAPGVYLYRDEGGTVLYVGKARVLKRRVLSYFRKDGVSPKTSAMLAKAQTIEYLTTTTEKEALLLEANLIKKYRPHYNIALRDDKQYFLFRLDPKQSYPRLEIVRSARHDGARYFGPFTSALSARDTWKVLHRTFGLRRCTDRSMKNRVRPCLYYHMKQCQAPCTGTLEEKDYAQAVERICTLLDGHGEMLIADLRVRMNALAQDLRFEEAAIIRDQIRAIERTIEQQAVILPGKMDTDVLGLFEGRQGSSLCLLFVRNTSISDARSFYWPGLTAQDASDLILSFLSQYYAIQLPPPRILLPFLPKTDDPREWEDSVQLLNERRGESVRFDIPTKPVDNNLIDIAIANAKEEALRNELASGPTILERIQKALHLPNLPRRIECVDVSHTQGAATRVGMVVYCDGEPSKDKYRVYAMPESNDDYKTLAAWIPRRLTSGPPWPDLLLIDGGRGQISAVGRALEEAGTPALFPYAGIAKARTEDGAQDRRAGNVGDRIFLPNRTNPLPIREGSEEILFLQQIRDATHHFAITSHRKARAKQNLASELEQLAGIGPKTARLLWDAFKSMEAIKAATVEELLALDGLGPKKAAHILALLKKLP